MNDAEFRADLLASAAARAEGAAMSLREGLVTEMLERLREAGETPDFESCPEQVAGQRQARLEIDAFAYDDADDSLHLFLALRDGGETMPPVLTLSEARDTGFARLLRLYEHAREGWLRANIEESRPLWAFARRVEVEAAPAALRLNILSDRPISERIREIAPDTTREGTPVTFQIWDVTRLKRIYDARSVRDDLVVDLASLEGGGLTMIRAADGDDYQAWLGVMPGEFLADIYLLHGSRLLEGNVRTFLGRRGNVNKGIAETLAKTPQRFFAYNNGIAATASAVSSRQGEGGATIITDITDMQIVNGAQTTASLAALRRDKKLPEGCVSVPLKLSVVPSGAADALVPLISRYANSQNAIRASDFFANHPFHQRMQEISRRILAPATGARQVQTRWYYERARGQYLNDQAGFSTAQKDQFQRVNPRQQVITKTDLAKIESAFDFLPDIACKGAEKAFTDFAERVSTQWVDESGRSLYSDDWYRGAVARVILFKVTEALVSNASWYEGGYRAQIVAYACARIAHLARELSSGGSLDWLRVWSRQEAGDVVSAQLLVAAEAMATVLRSPPREGMNVTEWAKQQACRTRAFATPVTVVDGFTEWLIDSAGVKASRRQNRADQEVSDGLAAVTEALNLGAGYWNALSAYAQKKRLLSSDDRGILAVLAGMPQRVPSDRQAQRALVIRRRAIDAGFTHES
jgi:hypothetical protein